MRLEHVRSSRDVMVIRKLRYRRERLLDILIRQRTCLKVRLSFIRVDPLWLNRVWIYARANVQLVPYDHKRYVRVISCWLKRVLPLDEAIVAVAPRNVVDEDAAVCAPVERHAQGLEALLSRRVPELEWDLSFAVGKRGPLLYEVGSNGRLLRLAYLFVAVAVQKGCLANARLTYEHHFEVGAGGLTISTRHRFCPLVNLLSFYFFFYIMIN